MKYHQAIVKAHSILEDHASDIKVWPISHIPKDHVIYEVWDVLEDAITYPGDYQFVPYFKDYEATPEGEELFVLCRAHWLFTSSEWNDTFKLFRIYLKRKKSGSLGTTEIVSNPYKGL